MFNDYSFVFDIDGTLCPVKKSGENYEDLVPYSDMVEKLKYYKANGAKIVLFTSRNMNSYQGNLGLINKNTAKILMEWLDKWEIPYDEILYGKPWPGHKGFYVDDRSVRPDEFLSLTLREMEEICKKSRAAVKKRETVKEGPGLQKIEVVITMGGAGLRFRNAGYDVPKYMIEAKGKTLFEWSMLSLAGYAADVNQYIFIVKKDEKEDAETFIRQQCVKLGFERYHIIVIDCVTEGQAATAMLAAAYWDEDKPLLIYNIDTYVEPGEMNSSQLKGDGFIPCVQARGDHWSFVRTDVKGRAVEVKEKQRISGDCTLGAYYFRTCRLYKSLYYAYYGGTGHLVHGEKYVAPLYNYLIEQGGDVYISNIRREKVHVMGTPEELHEFLSEGKI